MPPIFFLLFWYYVEAGEARKGEGHQFRRDRYNFMLPLYGKWVFMRSFFIGEIRFEICRCLPRADRYKKQHFLSFGVSSPLIAVITKSQLKKKKNTVICIIAYFQQSFIKFFESLYTSTYKYVLPPSIANVTSYFLNIFPLTWLRQIF